jgi:uncharacterized membrane protein required for colicin V production
VTVLDGAIFGVVLIGIARGVWIGLIRESFSIASLGTAVLATRYGIEPFAQMLQEVSGETIGPAASPWIAGAIIVVVTVSVMTFAGKFIRKGVTGAGLGFADRIGGGALGAAEGMIVGLLVVLFATVSLGTEHPAVEGSRSLDAFEKVTEYVQENADRLPDVAAPGDWL